MKKCLLLICATLMTMFVDAQEHVFTDDLVVKVNEDSTPAQSTTVTVTETGNGEYTFSLKNFKLSMGEIENCRWVVLFWKVLREKLMHRVSQH